MKLLLKILLGMLAFLFLAIVGYVLYVLLSYHRIPDQQVLKAEGDAEQELHAGESVRIVSYNLGFGAYSADYTFFMDGGSESRARSPEAVRENISGAMSAAMSLQPELLLLQEVDIDGTRSHHIDEYQMVRDLAGDGVEWVFAQNYDSPYLFWPLTEPHGANQSGQAVMSVFPISSAVRRSLPIETGVMKLVDLDRCYSVQRIPVSNGRELVLYNVHLSAYTSDGSIAEEQMKLLFADMAEEYAAGNYAVAGGDFNKDVLGNSDEVFGTEDDDYTWAQPIPTDLLPEGISLIGPLNPEQPVPSCRNADTPYGPDSYVVTADGFVVSANVEVVSTGVEDTGFQWSDHNPVWLDIILKEDETPGRDLDV